MNYEIDGKLRGPDELGGQGGIPADWHVDFVSRTGDRSHWVCVQFGSVGVDRAAAERIAEAIRAGLNSVHEPA